MNCKAEGCTSEALFICETCEPNLLICDSHSSHHNYSFPLHKLEPLCIEIEKINRHLLIMRIENLLKKLKHTKEAVSKEIREFTQKLTDKENELMSGLGEIETMYKDTINRLKSSKLFYIFNLKKSEEFILRMNKSDKIFQDEVSSIEIKRNFMNSLILEFECSKQMAEDIKQYVNVARLIGRETILTSLRLDINQPPYIHYFSSNTKNLNIINVLENKDISTTISSLKNNLCYHGGSCYISDEELLTYGGYNGGTKTDWLYLTNVKDKTGIKLGNNKHIRNQACCYHNGSLYVFGGCINNSALTSEAELAILKKDWKSNGISQES